MGLRHLAFCLCFFLLSASSGATTWVDMSVPDPIDGAHQCAVHEPASYGSYIYAWNSKYDQVFWPKIDRNGIWQCKDTGFTAFMGDFDKLTDEERPLVAAWLKEHYEKRGDTREMLTLLEGIYSLRKTTPEFRNRLLRVLARWYQELGDTARANQYRKTALDQIKLALGGELPEGQKLEYLYLAANYSRLFDDAAASDGYIEQLTAAIKDVKDPQLHGFADYLAALVKETPNIKPGGVLDPVPQKD